jgi:hypothetical protein
MPQLKLKLGKFPFFLVKLVDVENFKTFCKKYKDTKLVCQLEDESCIILIPDVYELPILHCITATEIRSQEKLDELLTKCSFVF